MSTTNCNIPISSTGVEYLKIASIFIILAASLLGTSIPILLRAFKKIQISDYGLYIGKSFGMGVILAVGFVHLLPSADKLLTNPCLSDLFTERYSAFSGALAMLSVLFMQLIQLIAINHFKPHGDHDENFHKHNDNHDHAHSHGAGEHGSSHNTHSETEDFIETRVNLDVSKNIGTQPVSDSLSIHALDPHSSGAMEVGALTIASDACCETKGATLLADSDHHHNKIVAWLLEFGISLHSIVVGITLGVSVGNEFVTLLVALVFHQFFEGFALSATVVDSGFSNLSYPMLMASLYALAAPVGISIGIAIMASGSYQENSSTALLVSGILSAVSGGILIYDALVNLITGGITHNHRFVQLTLAKKVGILSSLWLGAIFMSALGVWV